MNQPSIDLQLFLPELILSGAIVVVLVVDLFLREQRKWLAMPLSLVGVIGSLGAVWRLRGTDASTLNGAFVVDGFAVLFKVFFLLVAVVVLLLSYRYMREGGFYQGEYYFLLLTAFLGCMLMPSVRDLLMLFIAIELVSAPGFLMAAFRKTDPRSNEGGLKFFLIGVLSSAVMLYGMSLVYGLTGSLNLTEIATALAGPAGAQPLAVAGMLFVVGGFGFKVSSVPFHFWAPDTYEGAPVPVAAFLSVASKAAGFVGLLVLMFVGFLPQAEVWAPVFGLLSVLTMTLGNLVALKQTQIVRLLAYSSIAQAGYILLPFALAGGTASQNQEAFFAAVVYILIYAVMNLGAFAVVVLMAREAPGAMVRDYDGLIRRAPVVAVAMTMFLVSLAGIPPTAGFWGKFFIFKAAIGRETVAAAVLAAIMVVNSVISLGYYLKVVRAMIFTEGRDRSRIRIPVLLGAVLLVGAVLVVVLFVMPDLVANLPSGVVLAGA